MLRAYTSDISVAAGDRLDVMVSTSAATYEAEVVRLLHGDPNPAGPGPQEERTTWLARGAQQGRIQNVQLGSWIALPAPEAWPESFTLAAWVCPTAHVAAEQVVASWTGDDGASVRLQITPEWRIEARTDGFTPELAIAADAAIRPWRWHFVGLSFDAESQLIGVFSAARGASVFAVERMRTDATALPAPSSSRDGHAEILLGATRDDGQAVNAYNGKLGSTILLAGALNDIDLTDLMNDVKPSGIGCQGEWDFSREIATPRVVDVSGNGLHGRAHNAPARGVTGPRWRGPDSRAYASAPAEYNAVHLHDDDLEDAKWEPSLSIDVPADARSGIYAARLRADGEATVVSFIVRGDPRQPADVLFISPTMTWLAYANWDTPDRSEMGLSLYNVHSDGGTTYYTTLRKPTPSTRPDLYFDTADAGSAPKLDPADTGMDELGCHLVMADLYTIHWLERLGVSYDVISDHDFHAAGVDALLPYAAVVSAGHHEYWTEPMLDAMESYLEAGGHLQYMAGNGLYWVTSIDPQRPYLMEVRRGGGTATGEAQPGELQHSSTGILGGTWRGLGRPPQRLVGVGMAGQGFSKAPGFRRLPDSFDARAAFIFTGVRENEVIGDFGLNLRGAGGFEFDRVDYADGTPPDALLLASTFEPPATYFRALEHGAGRGPDDELVRGDMVYFERPKNGAVFSAGSITWTGSLSHNGYENNVARISENVLREFVARGAPTANR